MFSRLLVASVLLLGLGADARADSKGDWGQFIEKPGDHVVNKPVAESPQPAAVKAAKPEKVAKAPKASKAKAAPKKAAKRPAAHKH